MTRRTELRLNTPREAGTRRVGDRYVRSFVDRFTAQEAREGVLQRHVDETAAFRAEIEKEAEAAASAFGLDWRALPWLTIDALVWTTPDGEHWRWHGRTNNHGAAVIRFRKSAAGGPGNTEWTAPRILHRALVADHDPPGNLRQHCGAPFVCVRPEHRCRACGAGRGPT